MYDVKKIKDYILFLKNDCGLSVSLHPKKYTTFINTSELMSFNLHDNSYCVTIKTNPQAREHCKECQNKIFKKCNSQNFCGTCYAGVKEYIYPINTAAGCLGFISVSGYKTENFLSYITRTAQIYKFDRTQLEDSYSNLKSTPDERYIDTLLYPLCDMLELAYSKSKVSRESELSLAQRIEKYLQHNKNQDITSKEICKHFSCSRSYMSTEFNKYKGMTIRDYINFLRIADAKSLLKYSNLTVTEIAYSIGFSDANYFSSLFKRETHLTPTQYRKTTRV